MKYPLLVLIGFIASDQACGQGAAAELAQANQLARSARSLVHSDQLHYHWSSDERRLIYRINSPRGAHSFFQVDLLTGEVNPAFDHQELAAALAKASGTGVAAGNLPLEQIDLESDGEGLLFRALGQSWLYRSAEGEPEVHVRPPETLLLTPPPRGGRGSERTGAPTSLTFENATAAEIEILWIDGAGGRRSYGRLEAGGTTTQQTYTGHLWLVVDADGRALASAEAVDRSALARIEGPVERTVRQHSSPDGRWTASLRGHNLFLHPTDGGEVLQLSHDGRAEDGYQGPLLWSPDSRKLAAFRVQEVDHRQVHIVESSPSDQLQPKLISFNYRKPGDPIPQPMPRIFHLDSCSEVIPETALFDNPWQLHEPAWDPDSAELSFVYNQRGHQVMRIIALEAGTGRARVIHEDRSDTFIDYSQKFFFHRLPQTQELLWSSERDGHNHLYLIDERSGEIKVQITQGEWNVRRVVEVDEENRSLLLQVIGLPGEDPYHVHWVRVGFDGRDFRRLSWGKGTHRVDVSPSGEFYVASWSRVDQPPVAELRRSSDGALVVELARADDSALRARGWSRPERFVAKGRDGTTDIHGIIIRPSDFDPAKRYPVVESIYAGPHDHFVPQAYSPWFGLNEMAELGFIVVKIDGMGTNWRSKAFHDHAWKNLADAGFPDRIAWMRAAAETRPWMDLTRVGIYGGSAGGQSAVAALLHHGDFYQVAVADCGCHDNRMDKIWWNEAWMGWPVDASYAENSNMTHAAKLSGKLLLIVGELDRNVDPASTYQLVHALQQADKDFDFIPIIGAGHGAAETSYGRRRRADFLLQHLQGAERNEVAAASASSTQVPTD